MDTLLLVSLIYAGASMLACMGMCLLLAYVVYRLKASRAKTTY
jgi:ABC-type Fe3+ transport system permease subunit